MEGCCYSGKKKGGEGEEFLLKTPQKKKKKIQPFSQSVWFFRIFNRNKDTFHFQISAILIELIIKHLAPSLQKEIAMPYEVN